MKTDLDSEKEKLEQAQNDLSAWKLHPTSDAADFFNRSSSSLNIQGNTFQASKTNNLSVPVITDRPIESRSVFGLSLIDRKSVV